MRVISLTTIPSRFALIGPTLESLVEQRAADEIRLVVPERYRRFPDYRGDAPAVPEGVTLVRPRDDLGPASKVLPAVADLRGSDARILFCDDDRIFPPGWAEGLFAEQEARPRECVAVIGKLLAPATGRTMSGLKAARRRSSNFDLPYRLGKIAGRIARLRGRKPGPDISRRPIAQAGHVDVLQGFGGAVVRPGFFDERAFDIPPILWTVDDYWLSGLLAAKGIPIYLPKNVPVPPHTAASAVDGLLESEIDGSDRSAANAACIAHMRQAFGVWRKEDSRPGP